MGLAAGLALAAVLLALAERALLGFSWAVAASAGLLLLFSPGSDDVFLDWVGRRYFLQLEALSVNGDGGMLSTGSGCGSDSAPFLSPNGNSSSEGEVWKSLLPPGASMDSLREVTMLEAEGTGLCSADKLCSAEGTVLVKDALHAGFWFASEVLLYRDWVFLTIPSSDVCLAADGENRAQVVTQNSWDKILINYIIERKCIMEFQTHK